MRTKILLVAPAFLCFHTLKAQSVEKVSSAISFAASGTLETINKTGVKQSVMIQPSGSSEISIGKTPVARQKLLVIRAGDTLNTGTRSSASFSLGTAGTIRMASDTEVRVPEETENKHSLEMLRGQLFLNISAEELKKRGAKEFKLKTPVALLAVKGTKFFAKSSSGIDIIGVHEGSVTVTEFRSGRSLVVDAGSAASVGPKGISALRKLDSNEKSLGVEYAAITLVLDGVHNCCKACENSIVQAAADIKGVTVTPGARKATIFATKMSDAKKAAEAIISAGYFGTIAGDESISKSSSKSANVTKLTKATVSGVHLCCQKCVNAATDAVKAVAGVSAYNIVAKEPSFTVEGEFAKADLTAALNAAGFAGDIK